MNRPIEINVKRLYLPGVRFGETCPECKAPKIVDLEKDYLNFPTANVEFDYPVCCGKCDHEWNMRLRLDLSLRIIHKESFTPHEGVEEDLT